MSFKNRVRLPFYVTRAQFPSTRNVFRLANGSTKAQSIEVRKVYDLETDNLPEVLHQRLVIALSHDSVTIEGDRYLGDVVIDSEYEIDWQAFLDYPVAKANTKVQVTPFAATNSNCQTCEQAAQLNLVDDTFPSSVNEGDTELINVFTNDSISCYPSVASIITFNTTYVLSASIAASGMVTMVLKDPIPSANDVNLVTYRVTCPNGSYDEADIYADVVGSIVACLEPFDITGTIDEDSAVLSWTAPTPAPGLGYEWELYLGSNMGTPAQVGNTPTPNVTITGLSPATYYVFFVKSICTAYQESGFVQSDFTTQAPAGSGACGLYDVNWNDGSGDSTHFNNVTYLACDGTYRTIPVFNNVGRPVCAAQHSAGNPIDIIGATEVIYIQPC